MAIQSFALFVPEIRQLLAGKSYKELKRVLNDMNPADLAEGWGSFSANEQIVLFKLLTAVRAVELFEELELEEQMRLLGALEQGALGPVLEELDAKTASRLFHRLPPRVVRRMTSTIRREKVDRIRTAAAFAPNTAGSLMHTDLLDLRPRQTVRQALERVRASSRLHRMGELQVFYVVDGEGRLLGAVSPRALIAAPSEMRLEEIMTPVQLIKVRAEADQEEAAKIFSKYKIFAAPVVDEGNRLLGILSANDILHVLSQEATEDIAKMAGTGAEELETGSVLHVARLRMPWLLASWLGGILVSFIITRYEHTLASVVALAAFMPVIAGMGGNVGTQSSTIVVRGLATGHIQLGEISAMVWRELRIGLLLGLGYGFLLGALAFFRYGSDMPWVFPLVVGLGICTSMTVAAVMGAAAPMIIKRLNVDPAVCSAPFVSTATDIVSLLTYFSIATWLLL
ncbi:MAG: magnesium transporter [Elusimicrobiota bacterium]|jgi:magnesium transporter